MDIILVDFLYKGWQENEDILKTSLLFSLSFYPSWARSGGFGRERTEKKMQENKSKKQQQTCRVPEFSVPDKA